MRFLIQGVFILLILFSDAVLAQTDTIEIARQLAFSKKYKEALLLLNAYELKHVDEINSARLHAQIVYWMKDYNAALKYCKSYLNRNPKQHYLKLDYGRMLFELHHLVQARKIITAYLKSDVENVEALNMLGTIAYWEGKPATAKAYFDTVLKRFPENDWALNYCVQLKEREAPYLVLKSGYSSDTQPLSVIQSGMETGFYRSRFIAPKLQFQFQNFDSAAAKRNAYSCELGNKISISELKTEVNISAGIVQPVANTAINWIGTIETSSQLGKGFSIALSVARKNYQATLANFKIPVIHTNYNASLNYATKRGWNSKATYLFQQFEDSNSIQLFDFWVVSKPLKFSKFELFIGCDFNYSDSKNNRYSLTKPDAQVISEFDSTGKVPATYSPYFTPQNQLILSGIFNLSYAPTTKFRLTASAQYGFFAEAQSPYLYFDYNTKKELVMVRDYYTQSYTPFTVGAKINWNISKQLTLIAEYTYQRAFFFENQIASLSLKYTFSNGKGN